MTISNYLIKYARNIKKLAFVVTDTTLASTANARSMEKPMVTPEEVTTGSSSGILIVPLLAIILISTAAEN